MAGLASAPACLLVLLPALSAWERSPFTHYLLNRVRLSQLWKSVLLLSPLFSPSLIRRHVSQSSHKAIVSDPSTPQADPMSSPLPGSTPRPVCGGRSTPTTPSSSSESCTRTRSSCTTQTRPRAGCPTRTCTSPRRWATSPSSSCSSRSAARPTAPRSTTTTRPP